MIMKRILIASVIFLLMVSPALGAFCCGTETDPAARKCYATGMCCNNYYVPTSCYDFEVKVYGPGSYIVGTRTPILVQVENTGFYGDSYTLGYRIEGDLDGNPPTNPAVIRVDMDGYEKMELERHSIKFAEPKVTVISTTANDCVIITVTSDSTGVEKSDGTCIVDAQASIALSEFSWPGFLLIFVLAGSVFFVKRNSIRARDL